MPTCKCTDCYHYDICGIKSYSDGSGYCNVFKNKSLIVELPSVLKPLVMKDGENESDVYCPECGTNLSGYYPDCEISVIPCFECGAILDNRKSITLSEWKKEHEKNG